MATAAISIVAFGALGYYLLNNSKRASAENQNMVVPIHQQIGFDRFMSNRGPAFNASAIVKQTRGLSGHQPNWIKASGLPNASLNDPAEAERMAATVRHFLKASQMWEAQRFNKYGYRVILPNNRKVIFVKSN